MNTVLDAAAKVAMADQFYESRRVIVTLIGEDQFLAKVDEFRPIMRGLCEEHRISEMQATVHILALFECDGFGSALAMAACTEIMEPSLGFNEKT